MTVEDNKKATAPVPTGIAGGEHTLLWYKDSGRLYSTGACGLGWCRLLPMQRDLFQFRKVGLPSSSLPSASVVLAYASYYHNLAVDNQNKLYSWGCGTFVEGGMDGVIPALGEGRHEDKGQGPQIVHLPNMDDNSSTKIRQITAGAYHSAVLLESGKVLTFGAGQLGQLGRSLQGKGDASGLPVDSSPRPVQGMTENNAVQSIGSGFYNTFAVTNKGQLFCAGENQNQQCGKGLKNLYQMTRVKEVDGVEQVDGGYCHTLVKALGGKVYSMGCGDDGQRGDGKIDDDDDDDDDDDENGKAPKRPVVNEVKLPTKASQVAAGANHSVILGENGIAYAFGANDVGQCGVRQQKDREGDPVLSPQPVVLPSSSSSSSQEKVSHVSAGYAHTVITTQSGNVYVFGQNDSGQLGVGASDFDKGIDPGPQTLLVKTNLPE